MFDSALRDEEFLSRCRTDAEDFAAGRRTRLDKPAGSCHEPSRASTMRREHLAQVFNEMHGLIVGVGKNYCTNRNPKCDSCPLGPLLPRGALKGSRRVERKGE